MENLRGKTSLRIIWSAYLKYKFLISRPTELDSLAMRFNNLNFKDFPDSFWA